MITVRLYGLVSEYNGPRQFSVNARTVRQALEAAVETGVDHDLLQGALVFVNGQPLAGVRRYNCKLIDGDELALISPAGGG